MAADVWMLIGCSRGVVALLARRFAIAQRRLASTRKKKLAMHPSALEAKAVVKALVRLLQSKNASSMVMTVILNVKRPSWLL